jgi:membrane peptidoglycan carboxypeptidase
MGGHVFEDDEKHPVMQMTPGQILTQSSNVGAIQIAARLGKVQLDRALRRFGLGSLTDAKFPGQSPGLLLPVSQYADTGMGSVPIGYGLAVTPLQMLDVYTTLANGGVNVPPRLLDATIGADGKRHAVPQSPRRRVVSAPTAATVTQMLEGVVRQGTGACGAVTGFDVAGKTGTSRKPSANGYSSTEHMASFVGYAPAESPRISAIVVLDNPDDVYGGRAAAPVFSEIMQAALRSERVVPPPPSSNPPQWAVAAQSAAAQGASCRVPHGAELANRLISERAHATAAAKAAAAARKKAAYDKAHPKHQTAAHASSATTHTTAATTTRTTVKSPTTTAGAPPGPGTVTSTTTAPNG